MAPNNFKKAFGIFLIVNMSVTICVILYNKYKYESYYPQKVNFEEAFIPYQHGQIHNITFKDSSYLRIQRSTSSVNQTKRVLFFGFRHVVPRGDKCPAKCTYHFDVADVDKSHAIMYDPLLHWYQQGMKLSFPKHRDANQYWVLYNRDSAFSYHFDLMKSYVGSFNLTMTWRPDSDVPIPYGYVDKLTTSKKIGTMSSILATKTGMVAWVVSHCQTKGKREIYVKELQKFVHVDIYGKCGNLTCLRNSSGWISIERKYKFYLAFENSVCSGYVTEKTFRTLEMNIVPVVYGGANYKEILPTKSYIDILDFGSPRELANYLKKLDNDDKLYLQYFQWKEYFEVKKTTDIVNKAFCQLCHILHDPHHPHQEYTNVEEWVMNGCDNQLMSRMYSQWK